MEKIHHTWSFGSDATVLDDYALTTTTTIDCTSDRIMEHASRVVGITVANNLITYVDYTDNVVLFFQQATQYVDVDVVTAMQYESAKLGLHVSWSKT